MQGIELTGLRADLPISAMAALGCLRVCQRIESFRGSKLGWELAGGRFNAVLETPAGRSADDLVTALATDAKQAGTRKELIWRSKLKGLSQDEYHNAAEEALSGDRETADWFAAFGCETVTDRDGNVEPTPLDMTGGPQEFLTGALELAQKLSAAPKGKKSKMPEQAYREALFGPWKYEDDQHSLGWDPTTIKLGAFTYQAPTKMPNSGVMAAVWLAFESLPLFPCFSDGVRGFRLSRKGKPSVFYWPVWKAALSVGAIGSFLALSAEDMAKHGAIAVYQSRRFYLNKYYAAFRTPELISGSAAATV